MLDSDTQVAVGARVEDVRRAPARVHRGARWGRDQPILLRREESEVGHGARAVSRSVALAADVLAFLAFRTGLSRVEQRPVW